MKLSLENLLYCIYLSSLLYFYCHETHRAFREAWLRSAEDHCAWTVANPPNGSRRRYFRRCTGKRVTSGLALCFRIRFRLPFPLLIPLASCLARRFTLAAEWKRERGRERRVDYHLPPIRLAFFIRVTNVELILHHHSASLLLYQFTFVVVIYTQVTPYLLCTRVRVRAHT